VFLGVGGLLAALLWKENVAESDGKSSRPSIREAVSVVQKDPKIMLVGAVQSLFEAAMYIFVLQWPPAIRGAIGKAFGEAATTPYGTVFSCFMACCLLGSTVFGQLTKVGVPTEVFTAGMLSLATVAMGGATYAASSVHSSLWALAAGFFAFEGCVGIYFPSIGTLRSKYVPDSHRSVIMNLFGIPLNALVVTVFLSIKQLGVAGALSISTGALAISSVCMLALRYMTHHDTNQTQNVKPSNEVVQSPSDVKPSNEDVKPPSASPAQDIQDEGEGGRDEIPTEHQEVTVLKKEPDRGLFMPIIAAVSLVGMLGTYAYDMIRLTP
jgi:hypothetical protein